VLTEIVIPSVARNLLLLFQAADSSWLKPFGMTRI
jgi:hypothetical protein